MTIESSTGSHNRKMGDLFNSIKDYESGRIEPPDYNVLSNNCIQFAQNLLQGAGIHGIKLGLTPDSTAENIEHTANNYVTPLILDLNGDGANTLNSDHGVSFDFDGDGQQSETGWVHPDDALLVLDKNYDGVIDVGAELFGSDSAGQDGKLAQDGFEALSLYDANQDGLIDAADEIWQSLQVWQDKNTDGVSQQNELLPLDAIGIVSLSLDATRSGAFDDSGNIRELIASFQWADGREGEMVDILLRQQPSAPFSELTDMEAPIVWPAVELIGQNPALDDAIGMYV